MEPYDLRPRPSYLDGGEDAPRRPSEFDERIRKNLADELPEEDEGEESTLSNGSQSRLEEEKITTFLRIRPLSKSSQLNAESAEMFRIENPQTLVIKHRLRDKTMRDEQTESRFTFTKVLGSDNSQSCVFEDCMHSLLDKFFAGENCLVFSYGATNSGKTFTMQGYGVNFGIVPRTLEYLYNLTEECLYKRGNIKPNLVDAYFVLDDAMTAHLEKVKQNVLKDSNVFAEAKSFSDSLISSCGASSRAPNCRDAGILSGHNKQANKQSLPPNSNLFCIWISFAEIYNEKVYDLFDKSKKKKEMKLVQNKQKQVYIKDLTECCAHSAEEAYQLFLAGKQNLHSAATNMNSNSSRSHSFFSIRMVALGTTGKDVYPKKVHRITFCDLAGIERVNQTKNVGIRLKESGNINNSLMILLRCIRAMRNEQSKRPSSAMILPFRDSKLTRLFQSYLTTASRICMIASINPDPEILDSTLQVLQNCAIASEVRIFHKVESPKNNSQFARRVRASLALGACEISSQLIETSESESEDESAYNVPTVVSKYKNSALTTTELIEENNKLKEQLRLIEMQTREEMQKKFDEMLVEDALHYNQLQLDGRNASENLSRRRISLAARCFSEYPEALTGVPHTDPNVTPGQGPSGFLINNNQLKTEILNLEKQLDKSEDLRVQHEKRHAVQLEEAEVLRLKLEKELDEAEVLCIQYHKQLDEANALLQTRTAEVNALYAEVKVLKEDNMLMALAGDSNEECTAGTWR